MLHVLLLILKIIGWILLGIIGLLLLLLLLILFCPIRYQADVSYQGGKTLQAKVKVRYLILSVRVLYDQSRERDKFEQEIRVLWFRLGKKKAEEAEREVEHLADEGFDDAWDDIDVDSDMDFDDADADSDMDSDDAVHKMSEKSQKHTEKTPEKPIGEFGKTDKTITEIPTITLPDVEEDIGKDTEADIKTEEDTEPDEEPQIFDLDEPDDLPEEEKKRSGRCIRHIGRYHICNYIIFSQKHDRSQIGIFIRNHTPGKVAERVADKIERKTAAAKKKLRRLQKFWNLSCTVKTREYLKKYIPRTLKHILPRKVKGYVHYGMDEPYKTGQVTGYLSLLPFVYQKGLSMQPDFEQKVLELDVKLKGRIRLGYLLRIVLNINIWRTLKVAKKVMNQ